MRDEWQSPQAEGMDRNSIIADPLFVDPAKGNYRQQPHSPAWELGFERIPVEGIGCYEDGLRASRPVVGAVRSGGVMMGGPCRQASSGL